MGEYILKAQLRYMLSNWRRWDKKSFLYFFIRIPALVLQPIITAYIPKAMIDCIEKGVTVGRLTAIVALLSLLLTLTIWMDPFMKELIRGGARIIRMRYAVMAFRKTLYCDYVDIESLSGRERQKRAEDFYNARFSSGADFIETCNNFLVCVLGALTSAVLLYKVRFSMILLILLTCAGEFFLLKTLNQKQGKTLNKLAEFSVKLDYFYKLSKKADASKDLKLYGFQKYFLSAMAKLCEASEKAVAKYTHQNAAVSGIRAFLNLIRQSIAYAYLIYLVTADALSVSEFVFYFGIITGFSNWMMNLVFAYTRLQRCCNDCAAFRAFVEQDTSAGERPALPDKTVDSIEFRDVCFTYPSAHEPTIRHMSFQVRAGENIAIVGENGAGKTTAVKLLCGLYDATEGDIFVNGRDVRAYNAESRFDLFSAVFQDGFFLPMTIAQNVCGELQFDEDRLHEALHTAGIWERIQTLPEKEHTYMVRDVYPHAADFSGGEKQKLLLAKAIYKDAPVLILDEPTAALDPIAENELYLQYKALTENKISFFISHRLSSTRFCDRILFIADGKIAEQGTHTELMAKKGAYYRMYETQSEYYRDMGVQLYE